MNKNIVHEDIELDVAQEYTNKEWKDLILPQDETGYSIDDIEEYLNVYPDKNSFCFYLFRANEGDMGGAYYGNVDEMPPEHTDLNGFFDFDTAFHMFKNVKLLPDEELTLDFMPEMDEIQEWGDGATLFRREGLQEKIVKVGSKWQVQSEKGRNMGTYDTKGEAEKRLQQVHYFKHKNEDLDLDVVNPPLLNTFVDVSNGCILTDNLVGKTIVNIKTGSEGVVEKQSPHCLYILKKGRRTYSKILTAYYDELKNYAVLDNLNEDLDLDVVQYQTPVSYTHTRILTPEEYLKLEKYFMDLRKKDNRSNMEKRACTLFDTIMMYGDDIAAGDAIVFIGKYRGDYTLNVARPNEEGKLRCIPSAFCWISDYDQGHYDTSVYDDIMKLLGENLNEDIEYDIIDFAPQTILEKMKFLLDFCFSQERAFILEDYLFDCESGAYGHLSLNNIYTVKDGYVYKLCDNELFGRISRVVNDDDELEPHIKALNNTDGFTKDNPAFWLEWLESLVYGCAINGGENWKEEDNEIIQYLNTKLDLDMSLREDLDLEVVEDSGKFNIEENWWSYELSQSDKEKLIELLKELGPCGDKYFSYPFGTADFMEECRDYRWPIISYDSTWNTFQLSPAKGQSMSIPAKYLDRIFNEQTVNKLLELTTHKNFNIEEELDLDVGDNIDTQYMTDEKYISFIPEHADENNWCVGKMVLNERGTEYLKTFIDFYEAKSIFDECKLEDNECVILFYLNGGACYHVYHKGPGIDEELDLDLLSIKDSGKIDKDGESIYYVLNPEIQAPGFLELWIGYLEDRGVDPDTIEWLWEIYENADNYPIDIELTKSQDGNEIYVIVWDDDGNNFEEAVELERYKRLGLAEFVNPDDIPYWLDENLDLDVTDKVEPLEFDSATSTFKFYKMTDSQKNLLVDLCENRGYNSKVLLDVMKPEYTWKLAVLVNKPAYYLQFLDSEGKLARGFGIFGLHIPTELGNDFIAATGTNLDEDLDLDVVRSSTDCTFTEHNFWSIPSDNFDLKQKFVDLLKSLLDKYDNNLGTSKWSSITRADINDIAEEDFFKRWRIHPIIGGDIERTPFIKVWVDDHPEDTFGDAHMLFDGHLIARGVDAITSFMNANTTMREDLELDVAESMPYKLSVFTEPGDYIYIKFEDYGIQAALENYLKFFTDGTAEDAAGITSVSIYTDYDTIIRFTYGEEGLFDKSIVQPYEAVRDWLQTVLTHEDFEKVEKWRQETKVEEDLDLEVIEAPDDSWKQYHCQDDLDYSLPIYDAERLIQKDFFEVCWWLALYSKKDSMWYQGNFNDIPDESLNGQMTFKEAYDKFLKKELDLGDRIVLCYHQGAEYGHDEETGEDGLLFGEEDYQILARGYDDWQDDYSLFEDVDIDVADVPHAYEREYLVDKDAEDIIFEHGDETAGWYLVTVNREGYIDNGALDELHMGNGEGSFDKMYGYFTEYEFNWDEEKLYLMYDDTDNEDVYEVLVRYNTENIDEDLDIETIEGPNLCGIPMVPLNDNEVMDKIESFNIYVLPDGAAGYVEPGMVSINSEEEEEIFDYVEQEVLELWGSTDTFETNMNHIFVNFPKNRLTPQQVDFLMRNKSWLWESRRPEAEREFLDANSEYATVAWGFYGISTNDPGADGVDDFLTIHGYADIKEDLDLDIVDEKPELVREGKYLVTYKIYPTLASQLLDMSQAKELYTPSTYELLLRKLAEEPETLFIEMYRDNYEFDYELVIGDIRHRLTELDTVDKKKYNENGWSAKKVEAALATDSLCGFTYAKDWLAQPIDEDLDLDVQSITPQVVGHPSERHTQYKIDMATLYTLRELKQEAWGDQYLWEGGSYLDNLISRIENGDEDLQGDLFLSVFNMYGDIEYRVEFGTYCVCTIVQVGGLVFEGSTDLELAKSIEETLGLPKLTDEIQVRPVSELDDLLKGLLDDDKEKTDEDLDIDVADKNPTIKIQSDRPEDSQITGIVSLGDDAKDYIIGNFQEMIELLPEPTPEEVAGIIENLSNDFYQDTWIYGSSDMKEESRFRDHCYHHIIVNRNVYLKVKDKTIPEFEEFINSTAVIKGPKPAEVEEDLDLDVIPENEVDKMNMETISRFLHDMGEKVIIIDNVVYEGNPYGRKTEGDWVTTSDCAFVCKDGLIYIYYLYGGTKDWERIERGEQIVDTSDINEGNKEYTIESLLHYIGELWGLSPTEINDTYLNN